MESMDLVAKFMFDYMKFDLKGISVKVAFRATGKETDERHSVR